MKRNLLLLAAAFLLAGCATASRVVSNPGARIAPRTAYVVVHGGNSADMDARMQRELMAHGIEVKAGPDIASSGTDIVVRYTDDWKWDITMYLRSLDIQVYSGSDGTLLASGSWRNSALHGYHSADKVTRNVMSEIFAKLK